MDTETQNLHWLYYCQLASRKFFEAVDRRGGIVFLSLFSRLSEYLGQVAYLMRLAFASIISRFSPFKLCPTCDAAAQSCKGEQSRQGRSRCVFEVGNRKHIRDATLATLPVKAPLAASADPVKLGVVASLAHPGANVTGFNSFVVELAAKRLEVMKEIVPGIKRIGCLDNMSNLAASPL